MTCPGVGLPQQTRKRWDLSDEPLPCPVCATHVPTGIVMGVRVYLNHEGIA